MTTKDNTSSEQENSKNNLPNVFKVKKKNTNQNPSPEDQMTLEGALNSTDVGSWVNENKRQVVTGLVLLTVILFGGVSLYQAQKKGSLETTNQVYEFEKANYLDYIYPNQDENQETISQNETKELARLKENFNTNSEIFNMPSSWPNALQLVKKLNENNENQLALKVLESITGSKKFQSHMLRGVIALQTAFIYEELNQIDKALTLLELTSKTSPKVFKKEIYFFLGRLYMKKKDSKNAKVHFEYVLNMNKEKAKNEKEDNFVQLDNLEKLSKSYLSKLENSAN